MAAGRPGVGALSSRENHHGTRVDHRHVHVETLVVGAGVAGHLAAREAASSGDRVMLVDERPMFGGTAASTDAVEGVPVWTWLARITEELIRHEVVRLGSSTAIGVYDDGYVVVHQRTPWQRQRVLHVRAKHVVLATGAHERPIAFADNDRPGVMLASSAGTYLDRFGVLAGERAVVFTTNHAGHDAGFALREAGVEIAAVVDTGSGGSASDAARGAGIDVRNGWAVAGTDGDPRLSAVHLLGPGGERETVDADLLLVSGGWNPVVQLWRAIGGGLTYDDAARVLRPGRERSRVALRRRRRGR